MKRIYRHLNLEQRKAIAIDEAYFDMPDTTVRIEILAFLQGRVDETSGPAEKWLNDRGLINDESD